MRKVRWGVLGTADIARGQTIPGMLLAENCQLYAIAGRSLEKAESFKSQFGFEKAYGSYDALLADPQVEAVYIPLPNHLHCPWTLKALEAGKHVLCEKPLAGTEQEVRGMIDAANRSGVYLMEAFAYLHSPYVAMLKQDIDSGVIGDIRYIESAFLGGIKAPDDVRMFKEYYGGSMYDLGCYPLSLTLWLMGKAPEAVQAVASYDARGIDLYSAALLEFDGGARASIQCGMVLSGARHDRLIVQGSRGIIRSSVEFNQRGELQYAITAGGETQVRTVTARQNYCLEVEQLGRCILDGETPHVSNAFSLLESQVMDRVLRAMGYREE
mgnify:CR=1 FL=1